MTQSDLTFILKETIETCLLHLKRMKYANEQLSDSIPLSLEKYDQLDLLAISFLDQFLFRYTKLQDTMGNRLFPLLLNALAEPTDSMAFIDILNRLEKLSIIQSKKSWLELRQLRKDATHEYPQTIKERIEGLNSLFEKITELEQIIENCQNTINTKLTK